MVRAQTRGACKRALPATAVGILVAIAAAAHGHTRYAVLFAGGAPDWSGNEPAFFYETCRLYTTLTTDYGYAPGNVRVLFSDGLSHGLDALRRDDNGTEFAVDSPWDLDGDGEPDIYGPATQTALQSVLADLASLCDPEDLFLFWTLGHGATDGGVSYIMPWGGQDFGDMVSDAELAAWTGALAAETQIFVLGECGAGGFIEELGGPGRIVSVATDAYGYTFWTDYSPSGLDTYEFVYRWWQAVDLDAGGACNPEADTNGDGRISMREAFIYARNHDVYAGPNGERPAWDDVSGIGDRVFLGGYIPEPSVSLLTILGLGLLRLYAAASRERHQRSDRGIRP